MYKPIATIVASIIILLAALYYVESAFSPVFQNCIAKHKQSDEKTTNENDVASIIAAIDRNIPCSGEFIDAHSGAITALATIVIAAFSVTLWIATSTQAQLTREAFIADKRAFVFASGIQPLYEPDPVTGHFNWRIGPVWQNSGDTATQGLRLYTDGVLSNVPIPPTFDFNQINPNAPPGAGMLGPKMSSAGGQAPHMPAPGLTPQDILDIQNGRKFFYLWGWARYRDGLPDTPEHITRYCWRIVSTGNPLLFNPLTNPSSVRFFNLYETRGNCADDECRMQGLG
jgi:hypothetical protein